MKRVVTIDRDMNSDGRFERGEVFDMARLKPFGHDVVVSVVGLGEPET